MKPENKNSIKIVEATPEDAKGIVSLLYKTWLNTYPNKEIGITKEDIEERFQNIDERVIKMKDVIQNTPASHKRIIAKDIDVVIGVALLIKKEDVNQLQMIYVLPEYQGKGVGSMLWNEIKKFCDPSKDTIVQVASYNKNAISFYEKLGFVDNGKRWSDEKWKMKSGATIPEMEMVIKSSQKSNGLLMSYEEYQKTRHKTPYTVLLKAGSNFLFYFGERHSFNPSDEQWIEEKIFWRDFLQKTEGQKRIVFTEGGKRPNEENEEQSILKHGGMGLATFLAYQEKIETYSPELSESYERSEMEKIFSREQIQYYYFARIVHQWSRKQNPKPDFEEYVNRYLESDKKESGWSDFDFSLTAMKKVHTDIFHTVFNENDSDFFYSITNPVVLKTEINEVSRASSVIRDEYIVKEIQKYISQGYSIFAQYGCSHVVMQEPLLKDIFSKPSKDWSEYYEITKAKPPSKLLVNALEYVVNKGKAIDIGAGALKDTRYLLEQGFEVIAIDRSPLMEKEAKALEKNKMEAFTTSFENFAFPENEYDIASAMFSLPFTEPAHFDTVFGNIKKSLKKGGIFCGQFFGINDEWSKNPKMTFHTEVQAKELLNGLEILSFKEVEEDGTTANGTPKHWHIFHIIAKK